MTAWNLKRQRIVCATCATGFEAGARYFSLLSTQAGELARSDFCQRCWSARPAGDVDLFWWRTRHEERKQRGLSFNLEALEALFVALEGRHDKAVVELRFLLCLLLMRKRRLKVVRMTRGAGLDAFLVRRPRRQEEFSVVLCEFTPERMAELREELRALFGGESGSTPDYSAVPGLESDGAH
jgi:hypothetical protein